MKVLVFSDTHNHINECISVIENTPNVCAVIHAGDCTCDAQDLAAVFDSIDFYFVSGNNDLFSGAPFEKTIMLGGKKVFITHGHTLGVRQGTLRLAQRAAQLGADAAVFGHTHECCDEYVNGVHVINPGSMGYYPRTYALLDITDEGIRSKIIRYN